MKKVLVIGVILISIFLIYLGTIDKKIYYLSLGDSYAVGLTPYGNKDYSYGDYIKEYLKDKKILEEYVNEYAKIDYRTIDLIRDITDNKKVVVASKKRAIKNALIKSDLVTLSIGTNDILTKLMAYQSFSNDELYSHLDEFIGDLDKLLKIVREYCKEDIVLIGYYNFTSVSDLDKLFDYLNNKAKDVAGKYDIYFIELGNDFGKYKDNPKDIHPNKDGYLEIYSKIKDIIDNDILD